MSQIQLNSYNNFNNFKAFHCNSFVGDGGALLFHDDATCCPPPKKIVTKQSILKHQQALNYPKPCSSNSERCSRHRGSGRLPFALEIYHPLVIPSFTHLIAETVIAFVSKTYTPSSSPNSEITQYERQNRVNYSIPGPEGRNVSTSSQKASSHSRPLIYSNI